MPTAADIAAATTKTELSPVTSINTTPVSPHQETQSHSPAARGLKPKQKRNKPTLSCLECVERKTKCDRNRPCLACVKRQSSCEYTAIADVIAARGGNAKTKYAANNKSAASAAGRRKRVYHHNTALLDSSVKTSPTTTTTPVDDGWSHIGRPRQHTPSRNGYTFSPVLGGIAHGATPSNVFGIGAQHPFSNYWTCQGGLPEVISVLPPKSQADLLVAKYFQSVDPVYPFLHRRTFYADYERFWTLDKEEQAKTDASLLGLWFSVFALGTQFLTYPAFEERSQTAEFYCSAAHQALRVYSYLNRTSMRAISAMMLITYFLMNDNHASDAFAWAGIHLRQAYAMRLHRNPAIVVPDASRLEQQQRMKLWQAILFHDTFLTLLLKLPPTATHSDVPVESLSDENERHDDGYEVDIGAHTRRVENLMSISVLAPRDIVPPPPPQPHHLLDLETKRSDAVYIRSMWHLANLVQETVSSPNSLSLPLVDSPKHKEHVISAYRRLYKSFPTYLTTLDFAVLQRQAETNPRSVRQNLFLTSNYYHCLMMLQASENAAGGVQCNIKGALEAAHEAIHGFFKLWQIFPTEAGVWWVFQHRAFEESLMIAHLLSLTADDIVHGDPIFADAKQDIMNMMQIMERYGGALEMHESRKTALRESFHKIII